MHLISLSDYKPASGEDDIDEDHHYPSIEMNGTIRGAVEEFHLCTNLHEYDALFAECIRSFPTVSIDAQNWLYRLAVETEQVSEMLVTAMAPTPSSARHMCHWLPCGRAKRVRHIVYRAFELGLRPLPPAPPEDDDLLPITKVTRGDISHACGVMDHGHAYGLTAPPRAVQVVLKPS